MKLKYIICALVLLMMINLEAQCFLSGGNNHIEEFSVSYTSGSEIIDDKYYKAIEQLISFSGLKVKTGFYDDSSATNAFAIKSNNQDLDGETYFGINLINKYLKENNNDFFKIKAVMSHEFAHILQFKFNLLSNKSVKWKELQADYIAGVYVSIMQALLNINAGLNLDHASMSILMKKGMDLFKSIGDTAFGDPKHHGTPNERTIAFGAGFASSHWEIDANNISSTSIILRGQEMIESSSKFIALLEQKSNGVEIDQNLIFPIFQEWSLQLTKSRIVSDSKLIENEADNTQKFKLLLRRSANYEVIGKQELAINDLKNASRVAAHIIYPEDQIKGVSGAIGLRMGNCYYALGQMDKALLNYKKACDSGIQMGCANVNLMNARN